MIIKCLQTAIKTTRDLQLVSSLVYARIPYDGYDYKTGDTIDHQIFEALRSSAKVGPTGESQVGYKIEEVYNENKQYRHLFYRNQFDHALRLQINQTGVNSLLDHQLEYLKQNNHSFDSTHVDLYWINNKPEGHEHLQVLPKSLSITLDIESFMNINQSIIRIDI